MKPSRKYILWVFVIFILFTIFISYADYFRIGLLSDDYLNFYDALRSSGAEKFSGTLPFTNPLHFRPVYYISLEISSFFHDLFGFAYDNFIFYRVQNLILYLIISFLAGWIVLYKTSKTGYALTAALFVLLFPNNIHNICWTAGRVDLLCCTFYLGAVYFSFTYFNKKSKTKLLLALIFFVLALMSKETAATFPIVILAFYLFSGSTGTFKENKTFFISLAFILLIYLLYRTIVLNSGYTRYYDTDYLSLLLKSMISLSVPFDYLDLKLLLLGGNPVVISYLVFIAAAFIYYLVLFIFNDIYKPVFYLIILAVILLAPYLYIDYIRPQLILIPFTIIVIYLSISVDWLKKYFAGIKIKPFASILVILMFFFLYYSNNTITEWVISYDNALARIESLLNINIEPSKHTIIVGNAGRLKQSFMFDKLTGAYGFWKNKNFIVNDTINDIVQTGALDVQSLNSALNYSQILPGEFEISATGKTQFFYMEGFNDDRAKWSFTNKDMSVEAIDYNFFNKPSKIKLKILSKDVNCYLASELKYYKIY